MSAAQLKTLSPHPVARRIWMSSCRPLDPVSVVYIIIYVCVCALYVLHTHIHTYVSFGEVQGAFPLLSDPLIHYLPGLGGGGG